MMGQLHATGSWTLPMMSGESKDLSFFMDRCFLRGKKENYSFWVWGLAVFQKMSWRCTEAILKTASKVGRIIKPDTIGYF